MVAIVTGKQDIAPKTVGSAGTRSKEQEYVPTFMQTGQADIAPQDVLQGKKWVQEQEYMPTFAVTGQQDIAPFQKEIGRAHV